MTEFRGPVRATHRSHVGDEWRRLQHRSARAGCSRSGAWCLLSSVLLLSAGCATQGTVAELTSGIEVRQPLLESESMRAAALQQELVEVSTLTTQLADRIEAAATLTRLAEERVAEVEERLRQPLLYDVAFAVDGVPFEPGSSALLPSARSLLDQFAERLLLEDVGRYVEVHGHPDLPGGGDREATLARDRADAIRRYLHLEYGLPLFRISTVTSPDVAPGGSEALLREDAGGAGVLALSQSPTPER